MSRSHRAYSYASNTIDNNDISSPTPSTITASSATLSPLQMQPSLEQPPRNLPLIVPIDQKTVKRLVAGQAVMDLPSIVKELVDNALDAGARSINIRLFNQGLDVVEVTDDGTGVPQASRELMAMKHATSKIRNFSDIYSASENSTTLGFRGEALFCLANISQNLVVATRTADEQMGEKMEFNSMGFVRAGSLVPIPRKVGTTVAVVKPFDALPVRRADLVTRIKFYRAKLLKLIQGYAIFASGVRLNLIDITGDVGRSASKTDYILSTSERSITIPERVSSVLGSAFMKGLCPINVDLKPLVKALTQKKQDERALKDSTLGYMKNELDGAYLGSHDAERLDDGSLFDPSCRSTTFSSPETTGHWRIEGVVSHSPVSNTKANGQGFVARDLQFFCIDGRPVEMPRVSRALTDVWKSVMDAAGMPVKGTRKRPACVLSFYIPSFMYDINLSPDKREVLITDESFILDVLKTTLVEIWSSSNEGTFEENQVEKMSNKSEEPRPFTRMKRRNAFVNDPNTVGTAAPDSSYGHDEDEQVNNSTFQGQEEANTQKRADYPPEKPASLPSNAYAIGAQSSSYSVSSASDIPSFSKTTGLQDAGIQDNNVVVAEKDRRLWNQTKLQFNRTSKSYEEDPQRGSADEFGQKSQGKATYESNDYRYVAQDAPQTYNEYESNTRRSKRVRTKETSISSLSQFAYEAAAGNNNIATEMSAVATSQDVRRQDATLGSIVGCEARSKRKIAQLESQVSLSPSSTADYAQPRETSTKMYQQSYDSVPPMSTSQYENDGAGKSAEPPAPMPTQKESVVWNSFRGTADVIRLSQSSRRRMRRTQRHLRRTQHTNREEEKEQHVDNISKTGMQESVGLSPYEGEANTSLGKRKRSIHLTKDDFLEMEIVGQFNLGFILARCRNHHLWILDQHACDEKFNFERLCKTTVIHEQKLIAPLPLELSPSEEHTILENMDIFEQNGFRFFYNREKPPRHRLSLTALPHSGSGGDGKKAVQFGKEDVGALCSLLGADGSISSGYGGGGAGYGTGADGSGMHGNNAVRRLMAQNESGLVSGGVIGSRRSSIVRLPKAIAMFASRACRSSIMVGTALSQKKMEEVVRKMHDVDEPWNCPHGRPTMRHVRGLVDCLFEDSRTALEHVAGPSLAVMSQDYES